MPLVPQEGRACMKILIADDARVSLRRLERTLAGWGYEGHTATDGSDAWHQLAQPDAPKMAILDWVMPGLDGFEICRLERQRSRERYTYIRLLTAKSSKADLIESMNCGA